MHDALSTSVILEPALEIIRTAAIAYDPEEIYICSNRFSFSPDEVLRMQNRLAASVGIGAYPPKLHAVYNPEMEAMSGIISCVIGNWLDSMIVPQTRKKRKTADGADVNGETPTVAEAVADEADVSEDADA